MRINSVFAAASGAKYPLNCLRSFSDLRQLVHGLTTAACLWMVAGVGMAVGTGLYASAVIIAIISMFNEEIKFSDSKLNSQ